ncbi:MAG: hypothetical protein V7K18_23520 [Nostoc sp.]|uniref:hypothetical protein n=1 Tax=Nostoc sp. TaxID=1180 RepID=UPI002FFAB7F1
MPRTMLYHPLALSPSALDIRHQLIKILVEWQITSKNTHLQVKQKDGVFGKRPILTPLLIQIGT